MLKPLCALVVGLCTTGIAPAFALDVNRSEVSSFINGMVTRYQFDRSQLTATLRNATTQQVILDAIAKPAEKVTPWFEYRDRFLMARRIAAGATFAKANAMTLATLEARGAPVSEILGILGVETLYGQNTGRYRVLDALATLAFDYPPRSPFFTSELENFLLMTREQGMDPQLPTGSYAGAMGAPQFMPSSYRNYAVDGSGDGKVDLWNSWDDVLCSVANYLDKYGWRKGEPVLVEAEYQPAEVPPYSLSDITLNDTVAGLKARGVRFTTTLPDSAPAMLITLQGKDGPEYRVGFNNFYVLTRYNRSPLYVNAVFELGKAVMRERPVP